MTNDKINSNARAMGDIATSAIQEAKERVGDRIGEVRDSANDIQKSAKDYVSSKPITALAVTLGVGLLLGMAFGRR